MAKSFDEVLNVKGLQDYELGHIEYILLSPSYRDFFEPYLQSMRSSLVRQILDPSEIRKGEYSDDFLRGGVAMIDGLVTLFTKLVEEAQTERMLRSQQTLSEEERYQLLREQGRVKPAGQTEQPAEPGQYNPDEDY